VEGDLIGMNLNSFRSLLEEVGLHTCPPFYRDREFYLALLAGMLVLSAIYLFIPVSTGSIHPGQWSVVIALVIWQPFWEELLFRGIIQGQIYKRRWGQRAWLKISSANLLASVAFAAAHIAFNPNLWSVSVFIPSLVFGYFRERHNSIFSPIALHSIYNLGYMIVISVKPG
jgi:membrane protease YdiL (CAAX protease family)